MPGRLGDFELPADLGQILALVEQFVAFGELPDHLFGGVTSLLHAVRLAPFWSIRTLVRGGSFQRDARKGTSLSAHGPLRINALSGQRGPLFPAVSESPHGRLRFRVTSDPAAT